MQLWFINSDTISGFRKNFSDPINLLFIAILFGSSGVIVLLTGVVPVPFDSHYFVSILPSISGSYDPIIFKSYSLLRSPIYSIIGPVYQIHALYIAFTYLFYFLLLLVLYFLFSYGSKSKAQSLIVVLAVAHFPVVLLVAQELNYTKLVEFLSFMYPVHFGFDANGFSVRTIVGIMWLLAILCFINRRHVALTLIASIVFLVHPNNAISILAQIGVAAVLVLVVRKDSRFAWLSLVILIVAAGGAAKSFLSLQGVDHLLQTTVSNREWYFGLLKDEGDDFSPIYYFLRMPTQIAIWLLFVGFLIIERRGKSVSNRADLSFYLVLAPTIIYIGSLLLETAVVGWNLFPAVELLVPAQFGMKIMQLSSIPLIYYLFSRGFVFTKQARNIGFAVSVLFLILLPIGALVVNSSNRIEAKGAGYYEALHGIKKQPFIEMVTATCTAANWNPSYIPMVERTPEILQIVQLYQGEKTLRELASIDRKARLLATPDEEYAEMYKPCVALEDLVSVIRDNVPGGSSIVVPPYFPMLRDYLPEYSLFFTDKHDGNLILASPLVAAEMNSRMEMLLGLRYVDMASLSSGLFDSHARWLFLNRTSDDFSKLVKEYPAYRYVVTEVTHTLDFAVVSRSNSFAIYEIY
jgi:hypothetical protein